MSPVRNRASVLVPEELMPEFTKRLASLNTKATRFGLDLVVAGEPQPKRYYYDVCNEGRDGEFVSRTLRLLKDGKNPPSGEPIVLANVIEIEYPLIKLGDWQVIAQLEAVQGGNLVFSIVGSDADATELEPFADCPIECEHCNMHRQRKLSYVLKNSDLAELKQVGTSCLEDFTGIDPSAALFMAKLYDFVKVVDCYDEFEDGSYNGKASAFATEEYLSRVVFLSEQYGFVSSAKANDQGLTPTYITAWHLDSIFKSDNTIAQLYVDQLPRLRETANEIISWYAAKESTDSFDRNLKLLLASADLMMDRKHLAFAAAAIPSYQRHLTKQLEIRAEVFKPSVHVGVPGDKMTVPLTLEKVVSYDTQYGTQFRVNMKDSAGNKLSWKTANPPQELCETNALGKVFLAQFKIKEHGDFRDVLITDVSHLKFKEWISSATNELSNWKPEEAVVVSIDDTNTAAFMDLGRVSEIRSILTNVGSLVANGWDGSEIKLSDTNGNPVGAMKISSLLLDDAVSPSAVRVRLPVGPDLVAGLEAAAMQVKGHEGGGPEIIRDKQGLVIAELCIGRDVLKSSSHDIKVISESLEP